MSLRPPLPGPEKHICALPETDAEPGSYFECDICGRDYLAIHGAVWTDHRWRRVHWWERRKIRRRVGIDEHCPRCGYRSWRQYRRDIDAQTRFGGCVVVGYTCSAHDYKNWSPERKAAFNKQIERLAEES